MVYLLDTDHVSLLQAREEPASSHLDGCLRSVSRSRIKTSIVSFQQQTRGWLAWIRRARKPAGLLKGNHYLQQLLRDYTAFEVLPFDAAALAEAQRLTALRTRIDTEDLRIAAIARTCMARLFLHATSVTSARCPASSSKIGRCHDE